MLVMTYELVFKDSCFGMKSGDRGRPLSCVFCYEWPLEKNKQEEYQHHPCLQILKIYNTIHGHINRSSTTD